MRATAHCMLISHSIAIHHNTAITQPREIHFCKRKEKRSKRNIIVISIHQTDSAIASNTTFMSSFFQFVFFRPIDSCVSVPPNDFFPFHVKWKKKINRWLHSLYNIPSKTFFFYITHVPRGKKRYELMEPRLTHVVGPFFSLEDQRCYIE